MKMSHTTQSSRNRPPRSPGRRGVACTAAALLGCLLAPAPAAAHWCSNIWSAPAKLVIKPERSTVNIGSSAVSLRVYVQNNFPYMLYGMQMKGTATGFTISVSPSQQDVSPGQNVGFTYTISRSSGSGDVAVSTLNLQLSFRPGYFPSSWMGESDLIPGQNPSQSLLETRAQFSGSYQEAALTTGTMAEKYPSSTLPSGTPFAGRTPIQQLVVLFGYRFCYSGSGSYRCGSQDCCGGPDCTLSCKEGSAWSGTDNFPQDCMRAGAELAVLHARALLGSQLAAARLGVTNALRGVGSNEHKCLAAVVGAYLFKGASDTSKFTTALNDAANSVPSLCKQAGARVLGSGGALSCSSGTTPERLACAAAEGLSGNDAPVKSILMAGAGDGYQPSGSGYTGLYTAYFLRVVAAHRQHTVGGISFYPDAGAPLIKADIRPDQTRPRDTAGPAAAAAGPAADKGGPAADKGGPAADTGSAAQDQGRKKRDKGASGDASGGTAKSAEGGCGVAPGGGPGPTPPLPLMLLLILLLAARPARSRGR